MEKGQDSNLRNWASKVIVVYLIKLCKMRPAYEIKNFKSQA